MLAQFDNRAKANQKKSSSLSVSYLPSTCSLMYTFQYSSEIIYNCLFCSAATNQNILYMHTLHKNNGLLSKTNLTWHLYRLSPSFFAGTVLLQIMHNEGVCEYHMNPVATFEMDATIFGVNLAQMQVWDYNGNHSARKNKKINNYSLNSYVMTPM